MDVSNDSVSFNITSDVSSSVQSLQKLSETLNSLNNAMTSGTKRINSFTKAIQSLSSINTAQIQTIINNLNQINNFKASNELNKLANSLESVGNLAPKINVKVVNQLGESTKNLKNNMSGVPSTVKATTNALDGLPTNLRKASKEIDNLSNKNVKIQTTSNLLSGLSKVFNIGAIAIALRGAYTSIAKFVNLSNDYIENLNLFKVSLGDMADTAQEFVDNFSNVLGVDPSNVMRYTSIFNTLAEGFGIADEEAYKMSKNLTQLSYDLSSYLNIPIDEAMQKLKSGFSGEIEPMRAVGVALDEASLQETAYALGIDRKVSAMTRAQKTELLYYQIMTRTTQMQGDMARTLIQPANALRVLKQEFTQLGRAIGNIFIPMLMAIVPYVKVVVQWLTAAAQAIANFFGFQIDTSSWSNLADTTVDVASGIDDIGNSASGATKELKKMLAPFDELNVIEFGNDKTSGSGSGSDTGIGGSLGIPLPEYDATKGALSQSLEDARKKLEDLLPIIAAVGAGFLAWKISSSVVNFLADIGKIANRQQGLQIALGLTFAVTGAVLLVNGLTKILNGEITPITIAESVMGAIGLTAGGTMLATAILGTKGMVSFRFGLGLTLAVAGVTMLVNGIQKLIKGEVTPETIGETALGALGLVVGGITIIKAIKARIKIPVSVDLSSGTNAISDATDAINTTTEKTSGLKLPNVKTILKGLADLAIIVGGVVALVEALGLLTRIPGFQENITTGLSALEQTFIGLTKVAIPLAGYSAAMATMGTKLKVSDMAKGLADLAIVIGGIEAVVTVIGAVMSIPGLDGVVNTGIDSIITVFNGLSEIALPLAGFSIALGVAGLLGGTGVKSISLGLADLAIVIAGITAVVTAVGAVLELTGFQTMIDSGLTSIQKVFNGLTEVAGPIGGFSIALGLAGLTGGAGALAILTGLGMLAEVIIGLQAVVAAVGALSQIPGFNWLIDEGGKALSKLAEVLGNFVGSLVAGFADKVFSTLPQIGTYLSDFMNNAKPFFENATMINSETTSAFSFLASAILQLTAADILEGLTSWLTGGNSLQKFGEDLASFGPNFMIYANAIQGMDAEKVESSANAAKALADMASTLPNNGGILGAIMGENDLASFAEMLPEFGENMKKYSDSVKGVDTNAVTGSANAAQSIADMAKTLPNNGGILGMIMGENDLASFGDMLPEFGRNMKSYSDSVKGVDTNAVIGSANAAQSIANMAKTLPNNGGILGLIMGNNDLESFGKMLPEFGQNMRGYADNIGNINYETVNSSTNAAQSIANMASTLPNSGGFLSLFTGDNKLSDFGKELEKFGKSFKNYYDQIRGISIDVISAVTNSIKELVNQFLIVKNNGLTDIAKNLGNSLKDSSSGISSFFKNTFSTSSASSLGWSFGQKLGEQIKNALKSKLKTTIRIKENSGSVLSTFTLSAYAGGGFPKEGQMFLAREAGPELVGNIGNKAAVANNDQIIEGIKQGVYTAVVEANNGNNGRQLVNVYIGKGEYKKIYAGYGTYANAENNMYGANVIR